MLKQLLMNLYRIKGSQPGKRFHDFFLYRQMQRGYRLTFGKIASILGGLLIIGLGVVMIPVPGPGSVVIIFGIALIGSEFEPVSKLLDWLEIKLRPIFAHLKTTWKRITPATRYGISVACVILGMAATYGAYVLFF